MKIAKTMAHTLRVPFQFPLIKETQHALVTFVEIETDDGLKGYAMALYPLKQMVEDVDVSHFPLVEIGADLRVDFVPRPADLLVEPPVQR